MNYLAYIKNIYGPEISWLWPENKSHMEPATLKTSSPGFQGKAFVVCGLPRITKLHHCRDRPAAHKETGLLEEQGTWSQPDC